MAGRWCTAKAMARWSRRASASLAALLAAAACGRRSDEGAVVLRVTSWQTPEENAVDLPVFRAFERAHPGVRVVNDQVPNQAEYREKVLTSIGANAAPDLFLLDGIDAAAFAERDVALDLSAELPRTGMREDEFEPGVLGIYRPGGPAGPLIALPRGFTPMVYYYNKVLFDRAGLAYPRDGWTRDEFLTAARALTRDSDGDGQVDQWGTALERRFFGWQAMIWSGGGDVLSPDGARATGALDGAESQASIRFLASLPQLGVAPRPNAFRAVSGIESRLFYSGKLGLMASGHWLLPNIARGVDREHVRIGVVSYPRAPGHPPSTVLFAAGWAVPRNAPHRALAVELAAALVRPEAQRARLAQQLELPTLRSLTDSIARADTTGIERAFIAQVAYGRPPWGARVARYREVEAQLFDLLDRVLIGGDSVPVASREAARMIDAVLARRTPVATGTGERRWWIALGAAVMLAWAAWLRRRAAMQTPNRRRESRVAWLMLAPSALHLLVFSLGPLLFLGWLSVHEWDVAASAQPFVGLANYRELAADADFRNAVVKTALYSLYVPVTMALALVAALVLNQRLRGIAVLRAIVFLPYVASYVAIAVVWQWILNGDYGLLNAMLGFIGLPGADWLGNPRLALVSVMLVSAWMQAGYQMVIYLAGLQGIPAYLYEAARLDGAGAWQRFRYVTLPMLRPVSLYLFVTGIIWSFHAFTLVYVMTEGGPVHATDVVVYRIYQSAWEFRRFGYAATMSVVLCAFLLVLTFAQWRLATRRADYA
jgi:multiple sugar transport system permease protein